MTQTGRSTSPMTGLVLTGGGARAAYQVGVLQAVAQIRREAGVQAPNPFPVIAGTSAGAINAAALACHCDDFDGAVAQLVKVWSEFRAEQVYRTDSIGVIRTGARWLTMMSIGWVIARWRKAQPRSLLDICTRSPSPLPATARACTSPSTTPTTPSCRGPARSASPCARRSRCSTCSRRLRFRSCSLP